jgi:hypothetical protein
MVIFQDVFNLTVWICLFALYSNGMDVVGYTIPIIISMLMNPSEPPMAPGDYQIIELSKVYHHIEDDVCLGVESITKKWEWSEMPDSKDIAVHRYEIVDIQPNKILELFCVVHEKYEQIIYKTKEAK